jgi:bacillithiol biosynthesis deacetylase BshB1
MKLDILAIGSHPDDVELGCSGVLISEAKKGKKTGVIDLTQGELGTRGTAETRLAEADEAGRIMGISVRENMKLKDGFFQNDEQNQLQLIKIIRKYQPEIVIGNIMADRHPDHGRAGSLIYDSCFLSGLIKIETEEDGQAQQKWRPKYLFHYIQDRFYEPDIIIDISEVWEERLNAIKAYKTQFHNPESDEPQTYISSPKFLEAIIARARLLGKRIGVEYGEGFLSKKNIGIRSFDALVLSET